MRSASALASASSPGCWRSAEVNSRAAFSGCNRSWLAAARKRVLEMLAVSAARRACAVANKASDNSAVRCPTRCSSVSFTSISACSACL